MDGCNWAAFDFIISWPLNYMSIASCNFILCVKASEMFHFSIYLQGICMIYFIHLHRLKSLNYWDNCSVLGQRLGETLLRRFLAQLCWITLQKTVSGVIVQQPTVLGRRSWNINCAYWLGSPRRDDSKSNVYPQSMLRAKIRKP